MPAKNRKPRNQETVRKLKGVKRAVQRPVDRMQSADLETLQRVAVKAGTPTPFDIPALQRKVGNKTSTNLIQTKVTVGQASDPSEQEADQIANQVMPGSERRGAGGIASQVQHFPDQSNEHKSATPVSVAQALSDSGSPLEPKLREDMEQRFGQDFSRIRVHTGISAEQSAQDIGAQAYTVGHNIVFGGDQYRPETQEGQRLIAHELTHTIQHAKSSTLQVNCFVESEHKNLGNRATTKFPYFATLNTDEVALRSSPQGRKTDNKFYNLVASLRKDVHVLVVGNLSKWMRVIVRSGTALDGTTNRPKQAAGLTGYISEELLVKEPGVFDQQLAVLPGITLTYGDFTALGGDHFANFVDLEAKAGSKGGTDAIKKFVDVVAGKRKGEFEDPNTIDAEWAERYKNLALENVSHFSHGGTALATWKKMHYRALMTAATAGYFADTDRLQRAYAMNGFADHFLTDSFSSGHVRTPRIQILDFYRDFFDKNLESIMNYISVSVGNEMMVRVFQDHPRVTGMGALTSHDFCADNKKAAVEFKKAIKKELQDRNLSPKELKKLMVNYIGGAVAKVLHDQDNVAGLQIKSKKHPEGWKAFGDGRLDATSQRYILEAVEASKNEIIQALNIGIDFQKNKGSTKLYEKIEPLVLPSSKIEDYIPETDIGKSSRLPEWRISTDLWNTMDQPVQQRLATLVQTYLDDKTLDEMVTKIPESVEQEVDWSPNVYMRPRAATRAVLVRFRNNPVEFITEGAATPRDLNKAIDQALFCTR